MQKITEDFEFKVGMELEEDDGSKRYIIEEPTEEYIHLSGYDDFCMCESWYTHEEIAERFEFTGNIVDVTKLTEDHIVKCECPEEGE